MVHASERPTAGIRVGVRRRESAGSRVGGWRVYKIEKKRAELATPFSQARLSEAAPEFHLVGQSQRRRRDEHLPGRVPRSRQHRRVRSQRTLPTGGHIAQSDGTSWMAMYALNLLAIAMELAKEDPSYEDVASKFWEHFLYIARDEQPRR